MYYTYGQPLVVEGVHIDPKKESDPKNQDIIAIHRLPFDVIVTVTKDTVTLLDSKHWLHTFSYVRSTSSLREYGETVASTVCFKNTHIALQTSKDFVQFLRILDSNEQSEQYTYNGDVSTITGSGHASVGVLHDSHGFGPEQADDDGSQSLLRRTRRWLKFVHVTQCLSGCRALCDVGAYLYIAMGNGRVECFKGPGTRYLALSYHVNNILKRKITVQPGAPGTTNAVPPPSIYMDKLGHCPGLRVLSGITSEGIPVLFRVSAGLDDDSDCQVLLINSDDIEKTRAGVKATTIALNYRYYVAAIGLEDGTILVCRADRNLRQMSVACRISLAEMNFPNTLTGAVRYLQWNPGMGICAALWEKGGAGTFSPYGRMIDNFIPPDWRSFEAVHQGEDKGYDWKPIRLRTLEWTAHGFDLLGAGNYISSPDCGSKILVYSMAKLVSFVSPIRANLEASLFLCKNHIQLPFDMILSKDVRRPQIRKGLGPKKSADLTQFSVHDDMDQDTGNAEHLVQAKWDHIPFPSNYLSDNAPISQVAVNDDMDHMAAAGTRGFMIYNMITRKWRMFGNQMHEREISVLGPMVWIGKYVAVPCKCWPSGESQIRIYDSDTVLSNTSCLQMVRLPSMVSCFDHRREFLACCLQDGQFQLYNLEWESQKGAHPGKTPIPQPQATLKSIKLQFSIDFSNQFKGFSEILDSMFILRARSNQDHATDKDPLFKAIVVVNVSGRCLAYPMTNHGMDLGGQVQLSSVAEMVWTNRYSGQTPSYGHENDRDVIYIAEGTNQLKMWYPKSIEALENPKDALFTKPFDQYLPITIHTEAHPLCINSNNAFADGINQDISVESIYPGCPTPFFHLLLTSQIFVQTVLRKLIQHRLYSEAHRFAREHDDMPYFGYALEMVLNDVLDEEAEAKSAADEDAKLGDFVSWLKTYPQYLEVVAHCARKTEVKLWDHLFSIVGDPRDLFEQCLAEGKLETACSYLIVLQSLESQSSARKYATRLIDATLEAEKWSLSRELVRFLTAISSDTSLNADGAAKGGSREPEAMTTPTRSKSGGGSMFGSALYVLFGSGGPEQESPSRADAPAPTPPRRKSSGTRGPQALRQGLIPAVRGNQQPDGFSVEEYYMSMLLGRYARKLMRHYRLRDLVRFGFDLGYDIQGWMSHESQRSMLVHEAPEDAFHAIHSQFKWMHPNAMDSSARERFSGGSFITLASQGVAPSSPLEENAPSIGTRLTREPSLIGNNPLPGTDTLPPLNRAPILRRRADGGLAMVPRIGHVPRSPPDHFHEQQPRGPGVEAVRKTMERLNPPGTNESVLRTETPEPIPLNATKHLDSTTGQGIDDDEHRRAVVISWKRKARELSMIMEMTLDADCWGWTILLALALQKKSIIIEALDECFHHSGTAPDVLKNMHQILLRIYSHTDCPVCMAYHAFLHRLLITLRLIDPDAINGGGAGASIEITAQGSARANVVENGGSAKAPISDGEIVRARRVLIGEPMPDEAK
eukprot:Clim_evm44s109 gene=Clim_evmTU44s109